MGWALFHECVLSGWSVEARSLKNRSQRDDLNCSTLEPRTLEGGGGGGSIGPPRFDTIHPIDFILNTYNELLCTFY